MPGNNAVTWRWVAGITVSILLLSGAGWIGSIQGRVTDLTVIQAQRGERISALESQYGALGERLRRIEEKLDRIEDRLSRR